MERFVSSSLDTSALFGYDARQGLKPKRVPANRCGGDPQGSRGSRDRGTTLSSPACSRRCVEPEAGSGDRDLVVLHAGLEEACDGATGGFSAESGAARGDSANTRLENH